MFIYIFLPLTVFEIVSSLQFHAWGPGLSPNTVVLPARYFFLNISDNFERFEADPNKLVVRISGSSASGTGSCRLWQQILNRKDNSFIVRYRLYEECTHFKIDLRYNGKHIVNSPYTFKGSIYNEDCFCPAEHFDKWRQEFGCPKQIEQIDNDMKSFINVNMTQVLKYLRKNYDRPGSMSYCHYSIRNNELYRRCYGQHVGFHIFSDAIFNSILRKVKIPDQNFFLNLGDWPLIKKSTKTVPMFSWCGSDETVDIVLPTYDLTESTLENMGRVMLDMLSIQGNIDKKWNDKVPKAFWRGRDSNHERLKLVDIARQNPNLYDVNLTNFFFFRDKEELYGKVPLVSFFKFFDYKYQINMDGTVAAYRFPYLLVGDTVVLKQKSPYYEHFYKQLEPGVHYIPFDADLSDLTHKIQWAIQNDELAKSISLNGRKFAQENLLPKDIICYYALALEEWAKRINDSSQIFEGMERVTNKDVSEQKCKCHKIQGHMEDEL